MPLNYSRKMVQAAIAGAFVIRNASEIVSFLLDIPALGYDLYSQPSVICDNYWVSCASEFSITLTYEDYQTLQYPID